MHHFLGITKIYHIPSPLGCVILKYVSFQTENAEQGVPHSQFMSLVQNLLRDPAERVSFFQVRCVHVFTAGTIIV